MAETVKIDIFADTSSIKELKQQLLEARNQLSGLDKDSEGFQNVARRAGELKDQIKDVNEQVAIFASGSKFEQAGIALGQVKDNLMNLDFEGAAEKARSLTAIVKTISFGEATKGLKDLGSTFLSLGKALLTNPLFLIPAAIIGIISALGLLGPIIDGIKTIFNSLSDAAREFTDILGITDTKADKLAESQKKLREESNKQKEAIAEEGKAYISLLGQLSATNAGSEDRKKLIKDINTQYGTTLTNMSNEAEFQKQVNAEMDNYIKYLIAKYTLQANEDKIKKNIETQMKIQENYNKSKSEEKRILDEISDAQKRQSEAALDFSQTGKANYESAKQDIARLTFELQKQKEETGLVNQNLTNARQRFKSYAGAAKELSDTITELTNSGVKYNGVQKVTVTTTKEVEDGFEKLRLKINDVKDIFQKQEETTNPLLNAMKLMYSELFRLAEKDKEATLKINSDTLSGKLAILEDLKQKELANKDLTELEKLEIQKRYAKLSEDLEKEDLTKKYNNILALEKAGSDVLNLFSSLKEDSLNKEKTALDKKHATELAGLQEGTAAYTAAKQRQAQEDENLAKKAFIAQKRANMAQAIMNAAMGITSIIAEYPKFDGGIAMAAALISTAAINAAAIAKIASTQYSSTNAGSTSNSNLGSVTTPAQPSYQLFGTAGQANNVQASTGQQTQTINVNASVSVDQITDTQKKLVKINQSKTL